ncbi:MAG: DUF368 domain-containing protein [bacterium]
MEKLILIIKGFIIGAANIIPGVSGGTIMMSLGVFENILKSVNHFFEDVKGNFMYLLYIVIGAVFSLIIMSRVISYGLDNFNFQTVMLFIGLIVGGFPMLFKNVKGDKIRISYLLSFIIPFTLIITMSLFDPNGFAVTFINMNIFSYVSLLFMGMLAASSMIVPGLSGSFMLILFGYYEPIMNLIKDFTAFNNIVETGILLSVFGVGVLIGIFLIIRVLEVLLEKYNTLTYYMILGFVTSSVISIMITNFSSGVNLSLISISASILLFFVGFVVTYKLGE